MQSVRIHCYGCAVAFPGSGNQSPQVLARAGWLVVPGATYCPACAPQPAAAADASAHPHADAGARAAGDAATRTREIAALSRVADRVNRAFTAGVACLAFGVVVPAVRPSGVTLFGGLVAVICGPFLLWNAARWRRLLREARQSLMMVPVPLLLERSRQASGFGSGWNARLRALDGQPAALISARLQQATPAFLSGTSIPVLVYGGLTNRTAIIASGDAGVLVGSIAADLQGARAA